MTVKELRKLLKLFSGKMKVQVEIRPLTPDSGFDLNGQYVINSRHDTLFLGVKDDSQGT